jgi:hypothetical protein
MVKIVEKLVEKLKCSYQKYLKCPNTERLDADFHADFLLVWLLSTEPEVFKTET